MRPILSEEDLLRCFREIDRRELELAPELAFPLAFEQALSWTAGGRAFLLFRAAHDGSPRGLVFHRNAAASPDVVAMCEWCHAVRGHGQVKLLSVSTDDRRRIGLYLCSDLGCVQRSHELPQPDDLPNRLDGAERTERIIQRIRKFASQRLF